MIVFGKLYESEVTFSPKISRYNADLIAVWTNTIGPLQISNRYYTRRFPGDPAATCIPES